MKVDQVREELGTMMQGTLFPHSVSKGGFLKGRIEL
jgi:hypothetical protein